ncbi:MAG: hypothetical protein ABIM30_10220 [candidate division WOR-3 bacterium]
MEKKTPSMLNQERIIREVFDEETQTLRTSMVNGLEMEIEVNHEDGDSVFVFKKTITVKANEEVDCSEYSTAGFFGDGVVYLSPEKEGNEWISLQVSSGSVINICAIRLKSNVKCVLKA